MRFELCHSFQWHGVISPHQVKVILVVVVFFLEAPLEIGFAYFSDKWIHRVGHEGHELGSLILVFLRVFIVWRGDLRVVVRGGRLGRWDLEGCGNLADWFVTLYLRW